MKRKKVFKSFFHLKKEKNLFPQETILNYFVFLIIID